MTDVTVVGNISEPQLRFTPSGTAVLGFSLADNHRKFNQQSREWEDDGTTWRKVSVWEGKAEALAEVLVKGATVIVVGAERLEEYQRQDGSTGTSLKLTAKHVGVVPKQERQQQTQGGYAQTQPDPWAASQPQGGGNDEPPF